MEVILSRKGFDSAHGGYPSPILPDGKAFLWPIPLEDSIGYFDLKIGKSAYYDLMADLKTNVKSKRKARSQYGNEMTP